MRRAGQFGAYGGCCGGQSRSLDATATGAVGYVAINISNGLILTREGFTDTFVNGTAAADGTGGNGIPTGCFTASLTISGDTFGVLSNLLGCYTKSKNGFHAFQNAGGTLTCEAGEM